MASPATEQAQAEAALVAQATGNQVRSIAERADVDDIDAWWDDASPRVEDTVRRGFGVTARMAAQGLISDAILNGFTLDPVSVALSALQLANALRVTGPVAFKKNMRISGDPMLARRVMSGRLAGSAQRLTLAGARETIHATVDANPDMIRGYRRVTTSSSPCKFCEMLAGRGNVYRSAASAGTVVGRRRG